MTTATAEPEIHLPATTAGWEVLEGDSLELLPRLPANSVDSVVCDPPYGIDFKDARWDGAAIRETAALGTKGRLSNGEAFQAWISMWACGCLRAAKPGAYLLAFGAPRTFHRLATGIEDAGWELRDTLIWLYGTGMPKSRSLPGGRATQLKPAWEPIVLAQKPHPGTVLAALDEHGTGALEVDACRAQDHYPANVLLDHHPRCTDRRCVPECPAALIDASAQTAGSRVAGSRLFYCPKASAKERERGCEQLPTGTTHLFPQRGSKPRRVRNSHPTVKPIAVMRWLVRLVTPPGGLVLDPFCGSGTTGVAAVLERCRFLGIEREHDHVSVARARIGHHARDQDDGDERCPPSAGRP